MDRPLRQRDREQSLEEPRLFEPDEEPTKLCNGCGKKKPVAKMQAVYNSRRYAAGHSSSGPASGPPRGTSIHLAPDEFELCPECRRKVYEERKKVRDEGKAKFREERESKYPSPMEDRNQAIRLSLAGKRGKRSEPWGEKYKAAARKEAGMADQSSPSSPAGQQNSPPPVVQQNSPIPAVQQNSPLPAVQQNLHALPATQHGLSSPAHQKNLSSPAGQQSLFISADQQGDEDDEES